MKEIKTRKGMVFLVDDEDFESVSRHSWHAPMSCSKRKPSRPRK